MIKFNGVNKWFGKLHVLKDIDLHVTSGEVVVVCGPSGSGKSTLIRCINRLEKFQKGELFVDGTPLHDYSTKVLDQSSGGDRLRLSAVSPLSPT